MNSKLAALAVMVLATGLVGNAFAHKSQVIGDYQVEVSWAKEPAKVGKENTLVLTITKATAADKKASKEMQDHMDMKMPAKKATIKKISASMDHSKMDMKATKSTSKKSGVSGLAKTLQVEITLNGKKTSLTMKEDIKHTETYTAKYKPASDGYPTVHIYTKINGKDIEGTFHPEKVEK